ncbi:MAG: indolepyruvate ferredoxin oxidoreductase family protein [Betaproteobacteria bacterium]|nr:indolepyruvate ferredoxin oxidoreductase family protein [Betaproteobacteria bacterium]
MPLLNVTLADKYLLDKGRIFITGTQALVRLPLMQQRRDAAEGVNTACYISGYRGSPLGGYDQQLTAASKFLKAQNVHFQPGVNEDLAATACWGTQQAHLNGDSKFDGVFAIWYGKGPGVDRTGDAFRHGNLAGSAPKGGVLCLMGDDHTCESSTTAHQSEFAMVDAMIPVLNPAGVQELLDYGIYGWALSRYSGCWVGLKSMKDTIDATATVDVDPDRVRIRLPDDFRLPDDGVHIRFPDHPLEQEARLHTVKVEAVKAFSRANALNRVVLDSPSARLGIATCGKSYMDVRQAMQYLGIDEREAQRLGLRVYKVGMTWPMEHESIHGFAQGLDKILVVEEKRALVEPQIKEALYGRADAPVVVGKRDESGAPLFRSNAALDPNEIAIAIARRILEYVDDEQLRERLAEQERLEVRESEKPAMDRTPYFCSGCPHNTGTRVPEGSRAMAGIGCHFMAQWMDRNTAGYTQMGGEGASWMGMAPFVKTSHIFQNIGDGTYFHSGSLAVRAAVASGANMTYKILYNDAVAMTGGQHVDGQLSVPQITHQMASEGAKRIAVVTDQPEKYGPNPGFAQGVTVHHRDDYDAVQRDLRTVPGVSVIVYDQTCAAEKRRRRKRGQFPDPAKRAFINDLVCEGCGDCGVKSNCVSVTPLDTEFGRKRAIDQSACNKDYSCVKGFCPSFVTVHGGGVRKAASKPAGVNADTPFPVLPEPELPALDSPYGILVTGVGGTGVVTIGAIIGMAAHLEGKGFAGLDMAGLAQKGGAVWSHMQIATHPDQIRTVRLGAGGARAVLGCDLVVSASQKTMDTVRPGTRMVVNTHQQMTGEFTRKPDFRFPRASLERTIAHGVGEDNAEFVPASRLATALLGDSIATNMFMLGFAYQRGLIPVGADAIEKAIELNGAAVKMNQTAFLWGRRAAADQTTVERLVAPKAAAPATAVTETLDDVIARRVAFLTDYQDAAWARRYRELVDTVRRAEQQKTAGQTDLTEAVARYFFKLMAYKDEYEVARLHTSDEFRRKLEAQFEGQYSLRFHLAPPLFAKRDPVTKELQKAEYGPWMMGAFRVLARLRFLRGTAFDIFGRTAERRRERALIAEYETTIAELLGRLDPENHPLAVRIASIPEEIRGFGHVKERHLDAAKRREAELLQAFRSGARPQREAA